jgi:hypothetical protein
MYLDLSSAKDTAESARRVRRSPPSPGCVSSVVGRPWEAAGGSVQQGLGRRARCWSLPAAATSELPSTVGWRIETTRQQSKDRRAELGGRLNVTLPGTCEVTSGRLGHFCICVYSRPIAAATAGPAKAAAAVVKTIVDAKDQPRSAAPPDVPAVVGAAVVIAVEEFPSAAGDGAAAAGAGEDIGAAEAPGTPAAGAEVAAGVALLLLLLLLVGAHSNGSHAPSLKQLVRAALSAWQFPHSGQAGPIPHV